MDGRVKPGHDEVSGLPCKKVPQRPMRLVGRLLGKVVAAIDSVARNIVGPVAPDTENVVPLLELRALAPQGQHGTGDAAAASVRLVVIAIDAGGGAIILADGVDGGVMEAALVIRVGFRREVGWQAAARLAAAEQEIVAPRSDEVLRNRRRLRKKKPMPVAEPEGAVGAAEGVAGRDDVE